MAVCQAQEVLSCCKCQRNRRQSQRTTSSIAGLYAQCNLPKHFSEIMNLSQNLFLLASKSFYVVRKKKCFSPPPTAKSGNAQGSPSLLLMSPRTVTDTNGYDPELTPKAGRVRQPWQKFVPSPSSASPSGSILKRAGSLPTLIADTPGSSGGKRRVKFSDPPVSEQVC